MDGVVEELCADMILGLDFMKLQDEVNFQIHCPKNVISVDNIILTSLAMLWQ